MTSEAPRILLVEDDSDLQSGLTFALEHEGYRVSSAATAAQASAVLTVDTVDLVLLDVSLPDGSGFDLCREIRSGNAPESAVPILFLTARDDEIDVVQGLESGGDDYVTKPFRLRELLSRVKALLRRSSVTSRRTEAAEVDSARVGSAGSSNRSSPGDADPLAGLGIVVDTARAEVRKHGSPVSLTASEYRLLLALFEHYGRTLTRDQLADRLLGIDEAVIDDNTISVYIRRLREKLEEDPSHPSLIRTVRGIGYRLEAAE